MSSSGPPQKIQVLAGIAIHVSFCLQRRMTCIVEKRPSRARSIFLCVGPWCTVPRGTTLQASASGVCALVRAASERHSISRTC